MPLLAHLAWLCLILTIAMVICAVVTADPYYAGMFSTLALITLAAAFALGIRSSSER